jgi:hypothetical protein
VTTRIVALLGPRACREFKEEEEEDVAGGTCVRELIGHCYPVLSASFIQDGKYLASVSADKTLRLWDGGRLREGIDGRLF